jgi:hypothetical protein
MVKGYGGESHKKQVNAKDNTVQRHLMDMERPWAAVFSAFYIK